MSSQLRAVWGAADRFRRHARTRYRTVAALGVALAVVGLAALAPTALGHDGEHPEGPSPYPVPAVVEPGRATGAFRNVPASAAHEVWLVDQSDTGAIAPSSAPTFGGRIHIYDGADLRRDAASAQAEVIDLAGATAALCVQRTGANPVRPHMLYFSATASHAILSFVASGHVVFFDAATREPVGCVRTEAGAGGARQAHAAVPTPDDAFVLVANQNGKKLERIATDYATNTFTQEPGATLDLTAGTAPSGQPLQTPGDPLVRPDNAPICPFVPADGSTAFISLRGGGLVAVDPHATPMRVVADYPATEVARDGCGFTQARGWVYGNGGRTPGADSGWFVYRVPADGTLYSAADPAANPAVEVVDHDVRGPRDAHGVVTVRGKYVWVFDRSAHVVQIYDAVSGEIETAVNLRSAAGQAPAPDIVGISPDGWAVYAATRGPRPLSGAHAATGDAPGILVIEVRTDGRSAAVRGHASVTNVVNGFETADPHGLAVRPLG